MCLKACYWKTTLGWSVEMVTVFCYSPVLFVFLPSCLNHLSRAVCIPFNLDMALISVFFSNLRFFIHHSLSTIHYSFFRSSFSVFLYFGWISFILSLHFQQKSKQDIDKPKVQSLEDILKSLDEEEEMDEDEQEAERRMEELLAGELVSLRPHRHTYRSSSAGLATGYLFSVRFVSYYCHIFLPALISYCLH